MNKFESPVLENPNPENIENEKGIEHGVSEYNRIAEEFRTTVLSEIMECSRELHEFLVYGKEIDQEGLVTSKTNLLTGLSVFKRIVEDASNKPENESIQYDIKSLVTKIDRVLKDVKVDKPILLALSLERFRGGMESMQTTSRSLLGQ
jgi:hypothetical protein